VSRVTVDPLEALRSMHCECPGMTEGEEVGDAVKARWRVLFGPRVWDRLWDST